MPFLDHLEELRWRLLRSLLALLIGSAVGWWLVTHFPVLTLLKAPITPLLPTGRLMYTSPTEPFFITLKLAFAAGAVLASPVIIYQIWAFLGPALYERERRVILPSLVVGLLLFCAGGGAAYFLALPHALTWLSGFQQADLTPIITAEKYFGFAVPLILAFGAIAELPLVMVILAGFGLVTPQFLSRNRRYALLGAAAVAAFVAPPDALSMVVGMVVLLVLYEVSIGCVWIVTRRRARAARAEGGGGGRTAALILLLVLAGAGGLRAQRPVPQRPDSTRRPGAPGGAVQGHVLDTATARRLGLPTGPTRTFPPADALLDSLMKRKGYRVTRYVADSLVMHGDSQGTQLELRRRAFVDQDGSKLQADSIHYRQGSCRLDAKGEPSLFDQNSVMVGDSLRYDNCAKRGVIANALTSFQQGSATWFMRGDIAVDSGSTRMYGASSSITSSDLPVPDYHFQAGEMKWLNRSVMVARPAVLYVRDVPIMWLPFIFQDIRSGRRSGILVPSFGLNDIVRPTRTYQRHITRLGYYWVPNDYLDADAWVDWYAGRSVAVSGQMRYRWLDRFVTGGISYTRLTELDQSGNSTHIGWTHQQQFDSRTHFNAQVDYATSGAVVQRNTVDPFLSTAQLSSQANFQKQFDWGTVNVGGSRTQNLSTALVNQSFPTVSLTPSPVNITPTITWSPGFSYTNVQTFHNGPTSLLGLVAGVVDTLPQFFDQRQTSFSVQTPLRLGRWNWGNTLSISDQASNQRHTYFVADSADPKTLDQVLYVRTFQTTLDWQTSINLPSLFISTWKLQPGISILNSTTQGPFAIRNEFTHGVFVHQGKRLAFTAAISPTFFGFLPGFGPLDRIRHSIQFLVNYLYAPGAHVDSAFANAIDPSRLNGAVRSDPQQTVSLGLSQNIEGKLRPPAGDTTGVGKKLRLLSVNTSSVSYNFEAAKQLGRTGWETQTLSNTFASDLVPGFSLSLTHDLWNGPVGIRGSTFSPYLTNVSASFSLSGATIQGIGALLGLGGGAPSAPAPAPGAPPPGTPGAPGTQIPGSTMTPPGVGGGLRGMSGYYGGGAPGAGFSLAVSFTSTRSRPVRDSSVFIPVQTDSQYQPAPQTTLFPGTSGAGQEQLNLNLSFSPTPHWQVSWNTTYDLHTQQFGQHYIRLERDLRRWHASFAFAKSANGNLAFNFTITLIDQPDIKFDYDQNSYRQ